jgi:hypothetical protein
MLHVATMRADNIMGLVGVAADPGAFAGRSPVNLFFVIFFLSAHSGRRPQAFFFKFIVAADPHFTETLVNTKP